MSLNVVRTQFLRLRLYYDFRGMPFVCAAVLATARLPPPSRRLTEATGSCGDDDSRASVTAVSSIYDIEQA